MPLAQKSLGQRQFGNSLSGASYGVQRGPTFQVNLHLDDDTWQEVTEWAKAKDLPFSEAVRRLIKLGLESTEE